jgi:hypothetical protein
VRSIFHAPDEVSGTFALKSGRITQRGDTFADHGWVGVVVLELHPSSLGRQLAKLMHKAGKVIVGWACQ